MTNKLISLRITEDRDFELRYLCDELGIRQGQFLSALIRSYYKFYRNEIKSTDITWWIDELLGKNIERERDERE
jgi:hypothetical protein